MSNARQHPTGFFRGNGKVRKTAMSRDPKKMVSPWQKHKGSEYEPIGEYYDEELQHVVKVYPAAYGVGDL